MMDRSCSWDEGRNCRKRYQLIITCSIIIFVSYRKLRDYDINSLELLHKEILEFCDDISPRPSEETMRKEVVQKVKSFVRSKWYGAEVKVFGSFDTGLYLPTSDIDLVVIGDCDLYSLELELLSSDMFTPGTLNVLRKASVPIIKYEDKESKVKVDISFNMESGLRSAKKVKEYMELYPLLKNMLLVIKHYLYEQDLNEVYTGGIGSYSVILLIISFFQTRCSKSELKDGNLGVLLTNFFEFYGTMFDYSDKGIRLEGAGSYFNKTMLDNTLMIKDPADPTNVIKGTWNFWKVKEAFRRAFDFLSWTLNNNRGHLSPIHSPVALISEKLRSYRRLVEEKYGRTRPAIGHQSSRPYTAVQKYTTLTRGSASPFDKKSSYKMSRKYGPPC